VSITILYVVLGVSVAALVGVGAAIFMRVRKLSQASETQFRCAVGEDPPVAKESEVSQKN
jgi:ABC-type nitrate/sulfonate/bicarbonate transport system permease component